jgi:hypothetical protein
VSEANEGQDVAAQIPPRVIARAVVRVTVALAAMLALYASLPLSRTSTASSALLAAGFAALLAFAVVFLRQVRRITRSPYPLVAGAEAMVFILAAFVVNFALVYVTLATADPEAFSEPLNRVAAIYFAITVLATVGFGDIAPVDDVARIVVSVQMVADLVLIAVALRLVILLAQRTDRRQRGRAPG